MSTVITDNLTGKTSAGDVTITSEGGSATMQLQQGLAKAWATFQLGASPAINDSLNTSSLTDIGSGRGSLTWTSALNNADYIMVGGGQSVNESTPYCSTVHDHSAYDRRTTTVLYWQTVYVSSGGGSIFDPNFAHISINGDLS